MQAIIALQLITFLATGAVSETSEAHATECDTFGQAGMRACLERKAEESEQKLAEAEQRMRSALSHWDEDSRYVAKARDLMQKSTAAFRKMRENHCDFEASLAGGAAGNSLELRRLRCVVELNRDQEVRFDHQLASLSGSPGK